jgi:hypothetical protein
MISTPKPQSRLAQLPQVTKPVAAKPEPDPVFTYEMFLEVIFKSCGYDQQDIEELLRTWGIEYTPEKYPEIAARVVITCHKGWEFKDKPTPDKWDRYHAFCPICGATTTRWKQWDMKFGAFRGWRCPKDPGHFFRWRLAPLKKWMTRNGDQKDG